MGKCEKNWRGEGFSSKRKSKESKKKGTEEERERIYKQSKNNHITYFTTTPATNFHNYPYLTIAMNDAINQINNFL